MTGPSARHLEELRLALLALHKALVDAERVTYEQTVGAIHSPNHFLKLLTDDPWFGWLHPLSKLVISLDQLQEGAAPLTAEIMREISQEIRTLLTPSETGEGFSRHYFEALQTDTAVVIAHADLMKLLRPAAPT